MEWIDQIESRASIYDRVIAVLANKCDLLEENDQLPFDLEAYLDDNHPDIMYEEVSVLCNINLQDAMRGITRRLLQRKKSFVSQRLAMNQARASHNINASQTTYNHYRVSRTSTPINRSQEDRNELVYGSIIDL